MATRSSILAWKNPMDGGDYSPQGRKESDMTEQLHFHFHVISEAKNFFIL